MADGKPISYATLVSDLLLACLLPHKLAIVKKPGHAPGESFEAQGNRLADEVVKWAAKQGLQANM